MGELPTMGVLWYLDIADLRSEITTCQAAGHAQQVAYSTYHDAITQVCWTDRLVRTSAQELYAEAKGEVVGGG